MVSGAPTRRKSSESSAKVRPYPSGHPITLKLLGVILRREDRLQGTSQGEEAQLIQEKQQVSRSMSQRPTR